MRFHDPQASPFLLDLRAIGAFRVLLALVILFDQIIRAGDWQAFHSAFGVVSLDDSRTWQSSWTWSVYWISDGPLLPYVLEVVRLLATATLLWGIRSRFSAFVLFVLLSSVAERNPLLLQGGDALLVVMTFFAVFLPLGQRASLDALWFGRSEASSFRSAATAAYVIQVLLVWFMSGILKLLGEHWWSTGEALSLALHLETFVSEFGRLWRSWDWLLQPLTYGALAIECLAPLLALAPRYWVRLTGLLALLSLNAGIWLSLEVGLFPLIVTISMVPLLPGRFIDTLARLRPGRRRESGLVLFYDQGCRFCVFACRLLLAACGLRGAALREAQSEPAAARILHEHFAWSVTRIQARDEAGQPSELDPDFRWGWDAVRYLVQQSPRSWLLRLLPKGASGDRVYAWIRSNRGAFGRMGAAAFGRNPGAGVHGPVGSFVVSLALMAVLAWNIVTYPAVRDTVDLRPHVRPLISSFNLSQYWGMFAPAPYLSDTWHVMPALGRDGSRVDLLSGLPVRLQPPVDGPTSYGGYRWRKSILRSLQLGEIARVFGYYCRTGRWTAIDLWEFHRPNLGTAATAEAPYEALRMGRWRCDGVDEDAVAGFRSDIDVLMAAYPSGSKTL